MSLYTRWICKDGKVRWPVSNLTSPFLLTMRSQRSWSLCMAASFIEMIIGRACTASSKFEVVLDCTTMPRRSLLGLGNLERLSGAATQRAHAAHQAKLPSYGCGEQNLQRARSRANPNVLNVHFLHLTTPVPG